MTPNTPRPIFRAIERTGEEPDEFGVSGSRGRSVSPGVTSVAEERLRGGSGHPGGSWGASGTFTEDDPWSKEGLSGDVLNLEVHSAGRNLDGDLIALFRGQQSLANGALD